MLNKLGGNHLTKNFVKTILGITIALGFFGIGAKAYAWQQVDNAKIVDYGCFGNTCTLTIDRDHPFTRYDPARNVGTEHCVKRIFAWDVNKKPQIMRLVEKAYNEGRLVRIRYSEYRCYDASQEGGDQYMDLGSIWLKK
ncbi:MAG: hypothetical protein HXY43_08735 [Fischerella sp.]|jgi:hypothetical protein|uniref:hypothetical protein n=1 Tax=Fischerella sp. TaxID=1191 RepID=UPI0017B346DC|nr:hypothetical protein [Fischerella sp.]NWF59377.1 hypothetical protein [Fischerella sp.]